MIIHSAASCVSVGEAFDSGDHMKRTKAHISTASLNEKILLAVDTLEALAFFVNDLNTTLKHNLSGLRANLVRLTRAKRRDLYESLKKDIADLRSTYGAISPDSWFRNMLSIVRQQSGYTYIQKLDIITSMFRNYDKVYPRWPHIKHHAMLIFDGRSEAVDQIFEFEGALYDDAVVLLENARSAHKGISDFRRREKGNQITMLSYLRSATLSIFTCLEAYLNGLAYDCFQLHHETLSIEDHDLLGEWNSKKKERSFVPFDRKVFRYPAIAGKISGKTIDLSGCKAAHKIANDAKKLRDAMAHPSPFMDPKTHEREKIQLLLTPNLKNVEAIFEAAKEYVMFVETSLGEDPHKSVPWLF